MKLRVKSTNRQDTDEGLHEEHVKLGRRAKRKGSSYERTVAKKFSDKCGVEFKRTPQSGGFAKKSEKADDFRGDITVVDPHRTLTLHIECKNCKTLTLPKWIDQAESDCPEGRVPVVVFHRHNTSRDYVALSLEDFLSLVPVERMVEKRRFK